MTYEQCVIKYGNKVANEVNSKKFQHLLKIRFPNKKCITYEMAFAIADEMIRNRVEITIALYKKNPK